MANISALKSFTSSSSCPKLKPSEATLSKLLQTSPHRVFLRTTCSPSRKTNSLGLFYSRGISYVEVVSFLNVSSYCTHSGNQIWSSKRRSQGPVLAGKMAAESGTNQEDGKYKYTVDLPKTTFGMRANSSVREPEIQKIWEDNQVFKRVVDKNNGGNFILHDGPPYANGDLHIGHALNKILKDIINRYKFLQNYKVHFVPGWDCHGLPIELKVLQSLDQEARNNLTPLKLRAKAAKFAKDTVKTQMSSFKRYGVWGDWNDPYLTLDPEYEAAQIEVFGKMTLKGYIYRGRKPVHWSPSSQTALAEAELEYPEGHLSRSIYVMFRLVSAPVTSNGLLQEFPNLCLAIWTTTPWTVPANAAVAVNSNLEYAVVEVELLPGHVSSSGGTKKKRLGNVLKEEKKPLLIVASELVPKLEAKWDVKLVVKKRLLGSDLETSRYIHPIDNKECPVVIGGDYITTETGTGLVHTAPGHGQEDYVTGQKYGLPILSPVDDVGKFTEDAGQFNGLDVLGEGNAAVVKYLDEHLSLIMEESYERKYPYDWRTKKPTIFRATEQWFASVEGFRDAAMGAISHVKWVPPQVPPGLQSWEKEIASVFLQTCILKEQISIEAGKAPYSSVVTHGFVLDEKGLKMSKSLGNVVDPRNVIEGGKNQKEAPAYGADVLRLWVSSVDYTGDVMIAPQILRQMSEIYRKLQGTLRYLLANLHDWKADYAVPYHELPKIDQHALFQLENVVKNIQGSYENFQFFKIFQILQRFVIVDLSNFYFDVAKDRLYVGGSTSFTRRSCQTVLAAHLLSIVRVIAPILPHLAEDVWQNLPFQYTMENGSVAEYVFESRWPTLNERWLAFPVEEIHFWEKILELRTEVNRVLEVARTGKLIGASLDAKVYIYTPDDSLAFRLSELCAAKNDADTLHRLFITSQAEILPSLEDERTSNIPYSGECLIQGKSKAWVGISRAEGSKCGRCWHYSKQVGTFLDHPTLCSRCYNVVAVQMPPKVVAVG